MSLEKFDPEYVNVNVRKKEFNNVNVNVKNKTEDWTERAIIKLKDPNPNRLAYYKAWHKIGEQRLEGILVQAKGGHNPAAYFMWLIKKELAEK